tara:strand:+ start:28 stop:198 length:171 start_codon:yes stop_codon:yes gene_type:complete
MIRCFLITELAEPDQVGALVQHWYNNERLLSSIGYIPPAEAEANFYRQQAGVAIAA